MRKLLIIVCMVFASQASANAFYNPPNFVMQPEPVMLAAGGMVTTNPVKTFGGSVQKKKVKKKAKSRLVLKKKRVKRLSK